MWWKWQQWLWIMPWKRRRLCLHLPPFLRLSLTNTAIRETSGYWLSCSFTPTTEPSGYPQCTAALARPRRPCSPSAHPIASSPRSRPDKLVGKKKTSAGRTSCFLQLSWVSSQPSASHLRQPCTARAAEIVSRHSMCCVRWKEADYFLAMVHWLCRLA